MLDLRSSTRHADELVHAVPLHAATPHAAALFERVRGRATPDTFARDLVALRPELTARAMRLTRNPAAAEDLVQDAIERALRFREQFTPGTSLRSWAQTIVFTLFITGYRRRRREREAVRSLTVDPCAWTAPDSASTEGAQRDLSPSLRRALDALPASFREVLLRVDVGEQSYRDAADALGVPIGTVMSRLHRARKQLAASLEVAAPPLAA
ncbi:MAG: RNA polymerase sigma factor SigR [Polyangiales bacterium]